MIRPFMSSDGSSISETVVSEAWLAATRWSASATRFRGPRFLFRLPNPARELVADQLLRALEEVRLRLVDRHARDPLELGHLRLPGALQLLLQLLRVRLAVEDPLLAARQLGQLAADLLLLREDALLDLERLGSPHCDLLLDLGSHANGFLPRLDLRLPPHRFRLPARFRDQQLPRAARRREARAREGVQREEGERDPHSEADRYPDDDEHGRSLLRAGISGPAGTGCPREARCSSGTAARGHARIGLRGAREPRRAVQLTAARVSPPQVRS
jgi:hypothetical protein